MKKVISFILKLCFVIALFVFLFRPQTFGFREDFFQGLTLNTLIQVVRDFDTGQAVFWLSFAALAKLGGIFAGIIRWRLLLGAQGLKIPFWYLIKCWFMGRAIGLFLPGTVGLDGYRLVESARYTGDVVKCTTVIVVEKIIGFVALFFLVFLTLPLGLRLFEFNLVMLAVLLSILLGFIAFAFLLLMNPRIVQVLFSIVPLPARIRHQVDRVGAAVMTYSTHRGTLLLALLLGLCVHLGICLMYFGNASAIRAANTQLTDILFASPLVIVASIIGPTVSGAGVREVGFSLLLGGQTGVAHSVLIGHLGLWVGEAIPFLLSIPLLLFTTRPSRETILAEMEEVRHQTFQEVQSLHLPLEVVNAYRMRLLGGLTTGVLAGLAAGAFIGFGEALWLQRSLAGLTEASMFWWGPLVYGLIFAGAGAGAAAGLLFLYLLFDRFAAWTATFALSFSGALAAGGLVIGFWRFKRDVIDLLPVDQRAGLANYAPVFVFVAGAALVGLVLTLLLTRAVGKRLGDRPVLLIPAGMAAFAVLLALFAGYGAVTMAAPPAPVFQPATQASGPNIILLTIDAFRADYLKLYDEFAVAETPGLDAFAKEAVLFENSFSQASWTKPAFGTLFTGLYPESHTATNKVRGLPEEIDTLAEMLEEVGYYTQGFSNNPNVTTVFNFNQGFVDYVDLKPSLRFGAGESAARLSLYEVLRKARLIARNKLRLGISIHDFYQPAEDVSRIALDWIDRNTVPDGVPFYLYLHYMDTHDPFMDHNNPGTGYARASLGNQVDPVLEAPMRNAYITEIEYMDRHIAALFDGLKERGLYDNTLIVLTADHGEEFYDHEGCWHGYTLYDEMVHVPILLKLPEGRYAGTRNDGLARHIDLAPTILQFAGLPKGAQMPGQALFNEAGEFSNGGILYSYAENDFEGNVLQAVRSRDMKLIHANPDNISRLDPVELFDLSYDPKEKDNLADSPPFQERRTELEQVLEQYRKVVRENTAEPLGEADISNELRQQLESLGYLE